MSAEEHLRVQSISLGRGGDWSHSNQGLLFVFPQSGQANYLVGWVSQPLAAGEILVSYGAKPGKVIAGTAGISFCCFNLGLEHLYPLFAVEEVSLLEGVVERLKWPKLFPASDSIAKQCQRLVQNLTPEYNLQHRIELLRLATIILTDEFSSARKTRPVSAKDPLSDILSRLSSDEFLRDSVKDLAFRLKVSRRHLSRVFLERFGISVTALRMEMRMMKAVTLLRNPDAKVLLVAEQCGFNHLGLFNTFFKRRFGMTPTQWRKEAVQFGNGQFPITPQSLCPFELTGGCKQKLTPPP